VFDMAFVTFTLATRFADQQAQQQQFMRAAG
jgi:hypothetical protein